MYPNKENMIVVPITKRIEIITSIQDCPISQMNVNYKEMVETKAFLPKSNINIVYPNEMDMIGVQ